MCVCFCTFFIKVHDPSLRLTPQNPHSRKSSKKVSYFKVLLLSSFTHCYTMLWWADGRSIFIRIIHFWNNDNNFMGRPPPTGLDPTDRTASYTALSKRARLIAIPRITAVRVNCWCPLEFDICQSLAIVGGRLLADVFVFWGIFHEEIMISLRWLITYFVVNSVGILLKCPC